MLDCCMRIEDYTAGLGRDELGHSPVVYDAVLWNLAVLGEAANNVPDVVQQAHSEIPWPNITGTRNRIVHGYGNIREQIVWEIISGNIPELIPQLRALLQEAAGLQDAEST
ncbi:MAG: DUF86 domain-containing protein [Chloroflexi bacterium]|nr:DUF86 domain-containing protein [Chloroflexota bacterium]